MWQNSIYVKALKKHGTSVSKYGRADCVPKIIVAFVTLSILTVWKTNFAKLAMCENHQ